MGLCWPNNVNANSPVMRIMFQGLHNDSKMISWLLMQLLLHAIIWSLRYKITLAKKFNHKSMEIAWQWCCVLITDLQTSTQVLDGCILAQSAGCKAAAWGLLHDAGRASALNQARAGCRDVTAPVWGRRSHCLCFAE